MKSQTRKIKRASRKNLGKCCDVTMEGLHNWYVEMFEHLGWMVLAKSRQMMDKIQTYKNSLQRLHMAIEQKMKKVHNSDSKDDLSVMLKNVNILMAHVEQDFGM